MTKATSGRAAANTTSNLMMMMMSGQKKTPPASQKHRLRVSQANANSVRTTLRISLNLASQEVTAKVGESK